MTDRRKFVIDRARWHRGKGHENSRLVRYDGGMCCLGHIGIQCGIPAERMLDVGFPYDRAVSAEPWPVGFIEFSTCDGRPEKTRLVSRAAEINDAVYLSDPEREPLLIELFAAHNIDLEFIN